MRTLKTIRILVSVASSEGWYFEPGQVVAVGTRFVSGEEVPAEFAQAWVTGGVVAERVASAISEEETATLPPAPEAAVTRSRPNKRPGGKHGDS